MTGILQKTSKLLPVFILSCVFCLIGCANTKDTAPANTPLSATVSAKAYQSADDGTFICDGISYAYRLEITGKLNNSENDVTFVYLSNFPEITFDKAWKASGLSSDTNDYFSKEDAVLIEIR